MTVIVKNLDLLEDYKVIKIPPKKDPVATKPTQNSTMKKGSAVIKNPWDS